MPIVRGAITSLVFAIAWMALVFHSRPELVVDAQNPAGLQSSIADMKTWSFSPALLRADERAAYETAKTVPDASAALASTETKTVSRFLIALPLVLLGMALFWSSLRLFAQKKNPAMLAGAILGPPLPCLVSMSLAGFLLSGPPLAAGVVIALITLVSKRFATSS